MTCALLGLMRVFTVGWAYRGGRDEGWAMMNGCGWVDGLGLGCGIGRGSCGCNHISLLTYPHPFHIQHEVCPT